MLILLLLKTVTTGNIKPLTMSFLTDSLHMYLSPGKTYMPVSQNL